MQRPPIYIWIKAPFLRLLIPFIAGILWQWNRPQLFSTWLPVLIFSITFLIILFYLPLFNRYRLGFINGILIHLALFSLGILITWSNDIRNNKTWLGNHYQQNQMLVVTLKEPPVDKANSYKIQAGAAYLNTNGKYILVTGDLIIYFQKTNKAKELMYGHQIIFHKNIQPIKNGGNPGGFDYKRYCLFQNITHQVYLKESDYAVLPGLQRHWFQTFLFTVRSKVIGILRKYIPGKQEAGLAEALLIGYKDDIDKNLVQSYSNTGVVHLIAISGLHLGLVYALLLFFFKPFKKKIPIKWLIPLCIIICLWLFSLIAGAQPSVLRSALMFSCIIIGENLSRKPSIFNTLSLSAFFLLFFNPFLLWDVGFQLSYAAVFSIVIFMRPIYNWFYIENKLLDAAWKLNSITLAAQVFTLPISIYHFHQLPNLFLFSNAIAVPLVSIILPAEILLIAISFIPFLSNILGNALSWLISLLNNFIEKINALPFATWDNLQISFWQMLFLVIAIAGISFWLLEKRKAGFFMAAFALLVFFITRNQVYYQTAKQQKLIVYNVPRYPAIELINGNNSLFIGDTILWRNDFLQNFHLKPSRNLMRINNIYFQHTSNFSFFEYAKKKIICIQTSFQSKPLKNPVPVDILIISGNPRLYFKTINQLFKIQQVVFDGSVPAHKLKYWKKDCALLNIPFHDVSEQGAFVINLN